MLTENEARQMALEGVSRMVAEQVRLREGLHRFAAESVMATVALPGFDNSAMDGYAVRAADTEGGALLTVAGEQPAGVDLGLELQAGTAIRIFTGAPIPQGADAVIMQEDVEALEGGARIRCVEPVEKEENIRLTGCDLCAGQRILDPGDKLTPARLSLLASQGLSEVTVTAMPRMAIITTGDELVQAGTPLLAGQLYNSNGVLLAGLVESLGITEITPMHLPDDLRKTTEALRGAIMEQDVILLAGGVSVGNHDHVKQALADLGIQPEFWRVKVKPGKPLLFCKAERPGKSPCIIFGLPGNPVSAYVTYQVFVRPALLKICGAGESGQAFEKAVAVLTVPQRNSGDRPHYVRGRYHAGEFTPLGVQQSHALRGLSQANALVRLGAAEVHEAGARVEVILTETGAG